MIKAIILTGGRSTRMGKDKYLMDLYGVPQYQHLYEMVERLNIPVFLSCSVGQAPKIPDSYQKILDLKSSIGPIGGIASAIKADPSAKWLVMACDLVKLTKTTLQKLLDAATSEADIITYQRRSDYYETTLAVYKPSSFSAINEAVEAGQYSLQKVFQQCKVLALIAENEDGLRNANFPEDVHP